jgi:hypothetical protein
MSIASPTRYNYAGHDDGVNIEQDGGKFSQRPMTPGEFAAREPAREISLKIHELATYANFAYIRAWEIIAPEIDKTLTKLCFTPPDKPATWRCFHCGFATSNEQEARDHFGESSDDLTLCQHTAELGGLIPAIGYLWRKLNEYDAEETPRARASMLEFYAMGAKHATELRQAEESGYEKGLADGRVTVDEITQHLANLCKSAEETLAITRSTQWGNARERLERLELNVKTARELLNKVTLP